MDTSLARTPLHDTHVALGARMTPFAGFEMPLNYPDGILKEHLHVRAGAGLFDVSHMGQLMLRARAGGIAEAAAALEALVPVDVLGVQPGRQRYALFSNEDGGILDDLMIAHLGERLLIVVNAACKAADEAHLRKHLGAVCEIERLDDRALIALQGPQSGPALARLAPASAEMRFMDVREVDIGGVACIVSRSGYTGEDGFEISVPAADAAALARGLLDMAEVAPIGLGARDSLRLEAGLCLYGSDIDETTNPVEASLSWVIQKTRRAGGAREGGFPGARRILRELEHGPARKRVGLRPEGRAPIRAGTQLFHDGDDPTAIGAVTSGVFGPSVGGPVAMGYVPAALAVPGQRIFAELRGKRVPVDVAELPFVPPGARPR